MRILLVSLAGVLMFSILFSGCNEGKSKFTVHNGSEEVLSMVRVTVASKEFEFHQILSKSDKTATFHPNDSGYEIFVVFSSGESLRLSDGYVTSGVVYDDRINIDNKKITLQSNIEK